MLSRAWDLLKDVFLIPALDRRTEQTNHSLFRFLRWAARLALVFYLFSIPLLLVTNLAAGDWGALIMLPLSVILFPLTVRLVILGNVYLNGQTMKRS